MTHADEAARLRRDLDRLRRDHLLLCEKYVRVVDALHQMAERKELRRAVCGRCLGIVGAKEEEC